MSPVYFTKRGDVGRALFWRMSSIPDGLEGAAIQFNMRDQSTDELVIDRAPAAVADGTYLIDGAEVTFGPADGVLIYEWQEADLASARRCVAEFKIAVPGVGEITDPSRGFIDIVIGRDLDQ